STEHHGFGFVEFNGKEDADRAIELKNGVSVGGKKIGVKHAMPLAPLEQHKSKSNQDDVKTEKYKNVSTPENKEIAESEHSPSTIFVSNLPHSFTNSQDATVIETVFSDMLIRPFQVPWSIMALALLYFFAKTLVSFLCASAFLSSSGKEDADRAVELKNGVSVDGRKIGVKHAMPLAPPEQRKSKSNEDVKTEKDKNVSTPENIEIAESEHSPSTIFVSNLPSSFTNSQVPRSIVALALLYFFAKTLVPFLCASAFVSSSGKEDADRAVELKNGVSVDGQKIGVRHAMPLAPLEQRKSKSNHVYSDDVKTEKDNKLAHEKKLQEEKTADHDHRNLYLAKEGLIVERTPAAEGVSASDMSRRKKLEEKRKIMLQSPNFHVSETQLVIYNLPRSMTEKELRKLLIDAVVSRAAKQNPVIRQVKLLGNSIKENVKSKSRFHRVAFVEFSEHQHALVALRVLNNNPETFGPSRRPIVSFALDDVRKLKLRKFAQQQPIHNESEGMQHDDEAKTPRIPPSKNKSRKRKPMGDIGSSDTPEANKEETTENRTSGGATTKKDRPAKKRKGTQANSKENKFATKVTLKGSNQRNKNRQKGKKQRPESKPDAAGEPDFMPEKGKLQEASAEPGRNNVSKQQKKSGKYQNVSSRKEVVDLLDRLIEQYR
ncbi:RNA recognition motif domain, partial [Dillenia turbinata]